jgi:cytoskeletal protein CcmA (bactofilin family)
MFQKNKVKAQPIASLIGGQTHIDGNVRFSGGLRIDGSVNGSVVSSDERGGMLVVSETGSIRGDVVAAHLVVSGQIHGPVTSSELVELQPSAKVMGDVRYRALEMHHGAVVHGRMIHLAADGRETALTHDLDTPPSEVAAPAPDAEQPA